MLITDLAKDAVREMVVRDARLAANAGEKPELGCGAVREMAFSNQVSVASQFVQYFRILRDA